jgi:hypothetical protein
MTKNLKKIIRESLGVINSLNGITNEVVNQIQQIIVDKSYLKYQSFRIFLGDNDMEIHEIVLSIEDKDVISGNIDISKTKKNVDNKYVIYINIFFDENLPPTNKQVSSIISHELHHFYDHIIRKDKHSTTKPLTKKLGKIKNSLPIELKSNGHVRKFIDMFYYSLDEEVNARVQQLYEEIKDFNTKEEVIDYIMKSHPYVVSKQMIEYKLDMSDELKLGVWGVIHHYIDESMDSFFNKFVNRINKKGEKLKYNLLRLVSKVTNIQEHVIVSHIVENDIKW